MFICIAVWIDFGHWPYDVSLTWDLTKWNTVSLDPWRKQIRWDWLFRSRCATKLKGKVFGPAPGQLWLVGGSWLRGYQTVRAGRHCAWWRGWLGKGSLVVLEGTGRGKTVQSRGTSHTVQNNLCDGGGWNTLLEYCAVIACAWVLPAKALRGPVSGGGL